MSLSTPTRGSAPETGSGAVTLELGAASVTSLERLRRALETVLLRCPELPVLAIRWMHLKHPLHPVQEALLHDERERRAGPPGDHRLDLLRGIVRCTLYAAYLSCRLVRLRLLMRREREELRRQRFDVIAKTCCFGVDKSADDRDFYYGDLQARVAGRGFRMLLLCGDIFEGSWSAFARAHIATGPQGRLPELCLVHPFVPLLLTWRQLTSSIRLRRVAGRSSDPLVARLARRASVDCLAPDTALTGLVFWIARTAVRIWRPRAFVTFYEGHAWEKCAWWGVKTADPACRTIGYQHSMVFPESLSLTAPAVDSTDASLPDVVLCVGPRTRAMLEAGHASAGSRLVSFGTFQRSPGDGVSLAPEPRRRTVLVLPEAIVNEARLLFDFATEVATRARDHHFILRCHPAQSFDDLRPYLRQAPDRLPNVEISSGAAFDADCGRSSVALYRGSAAVAYAVSHGLKPVYLHADGCPDADPLFELAQWRERVSSPVAMVDLLRRYAVTSDAEATALWRYAAAYVNTYLTPVDETSIERFLTTAGISGEDVRA